MCCQSENGAVWSSWYTNVQEVARRSARWLFGWLPCLKGHHIIHPAITSDPESLFVVLDTRKKIRVLHLCPRLGDAVLLSKITSVGFDHVDCVDQAGSEGSGGEDYWFMRWNRPLRSDFQRNSCNCSFRKSHPKDVQGSNQTESAHFKTSEISLAHVACTDQPPDHLIECSKDIVSEEGERKISQQRTQDSEIKNLSSSVSLENFGKNSANNCDIDIREIKFSFKETTEKDGGYVNPIFRASNDSLDCIGQKERANSHCDISSTLDSSHVKQIIPSNKLNEHGQDHNANHQTLEEMNTLNKVEQPADGQVDNITDTGRRKHRKHCNAGPKAYLKKPLLFMIHGAGSNCEIWRGLVYHMVHAGFECVAPDILGHGLSSAPDSAGMYTFHSLLQDLLGIFDRFVTEGRQAVMIGHGYGCSLAAAMTRYRAEQVIQLVLISGGGPTPLAPRTAPSVSPCMRCCLEPLLMCGFKRDVVYSVCGKQIEPCSPEECAMPRHILDHIAQGHVWPEGDAAFHRRIVSPTLLVHGMRDQHITLVQQCEMERTIPRSFLEIIPEAGHWAMLETPDHLSHMILCFINWWAPASRAH